MSKSYSRKVMDAQTIDLKARGYAERCLGEMLAALPESARMPRSHYETFFNGLIWKFSIILRAGREDLIIMPENATPEQRENMTLEVAKIFRAAGVV